MIALLPVLWFSFDRMYVLNSGAVYEAEVLDCSGSWVRRGSSGNRAGTMELRHKPVAYAETGVKAVGAVLLSHEWCVRMLGSQVALVSAKGMPPRYISFIQYWLILSLGWYLAGVWLLALLGTRAPLLVTFNVGYFASAAIMVYAELNPHTAPELAQDPSARILSLCVKRELLDQDVEAPALLRSLRCQNALISELGSLPPLAALEALYLQGSSLTSLESAPALPALRKLSVAGSGALTSLAGIERYTQLTELQANQCALSDLDGLDALSELRIVAFMRNRLQTQALQALSDLNALEDVLLNYNDIEDLSALAAKPQLRELQAYGNRISDVSALYGNTALTLVGVRGRADIPCAQIRTLRSKLAPDARVFGPKACD